MTLSIARQIVIPIGWLSAPSAALQLPLVWPVKQQAGTLDYSIDCTAIVTDLSSPIASVSLAIAPSGTGELQAASPLLAGNIASALFSGGQPGRVYTVQLTLDLFDGERIIVPVGLSVAPLLGAADIAPPPNPGFGAPVVWSWNVGLDFSDARNSGYIGAIAGV